MWECNNRGSASSALQKIVISCVFDIFGSDKVQIGKKKVHFCLLRGQRVTVMITSSLNTNCVSLKVKIILLKRITESVLSFYQVRGWRHSGAAHFWWISVNMTWMQGCLFVLKLPPNPQRWLCTQSGAVRRSDLHSQKLPANHKARPQSLWQDIGK